MKVSKKIRLAMVEAGLTQKTLGERLNVTGSVISRWITGTSNPVVSSLERIAKATNKPLSYFLNDADTIFNNTGNNYVAGKNQNVNSDTNLMNVINTKNDFILEKLTKLDFVLEKLTKLDLVLEKLTKKGGD
jgi:transcriptional regulator with XRE-family HTH domain